MKKGVLVFVGMLALTPATYAVETISPLSEIAAPWDNIQVKGVVVDESGSPLPGVSVYVKGTTNGTITDIDGNFNINVESNATLVFSFVGFTTQEIAVNGRSSLGSITMQEDNKEIEQVVVIGYGTQKKVDLTGSVAVVDADEMKKVSNSNISTMLEGKVAGVSITTNGEPGADPAVRIRGIGSFGDTAPLYVVDGVPMGTSIRDFSPNDIASIQILKDASAAAIYGSRAANGVVIITTKSGKKNQPMKVDYTGYVGVDVVNNVYDVMDSEQFVDFINKAYNNSGEIAPSGYDATSENYFLGEKNYTNTNWFDEMFKVGVRQNHNINLSGGSENSTYNVGLDYYDQKGTLEGTGPNFKRYTARVNNTMDVKFVKLRTGIVYSHSDQDGISYVPGDYVEGIYGGIGNILQSVLTTVPTIKAYDESTWCLDGVDPSASAYAYDAYGFGTYYPLLHGEIGQINPLLLNSIISKNTKCDRLVATASANVDLFGMVNQKFQNHKLSYNINLSWSKTTAKDHSWHGAFYPSNKTAFPKTNENLAMAQRNYSTGLLENTINYEGTIADKNHISVVVGQTFERELHDRIDAVGKTYTEPYFLQIQNADSREASTYEDEHVLTSYIGRVNYDYDSKYLISATVRRDGSSRLSSDSRWGTFPSVSVGWRLDREEFFPVDDHLVNLLKIRGSYGVLGNENIGNYRYMSVMQRNNFIANFGGNIVTGSKPTEFVNSAIAWEKKKSTSVGMDLGMLSGQIEFTFEYYKNVSEDLLFEVPIPATTGVKSPSATMNAASMENSGFEWSVNYHNYKHKVKYDVAFNASTMKNKVTSLGYGNDGKQINGDAITIVGQELGQFFGLKYEGIFETQEQIDNHATQVGAKVGDCAFEDYNNDGKIDLEDRQVLGSGFPKINFGLSARAEYKNFDLSVSTHGALGFKVFDIMNQNIHDCYSLGNKATDIFDAGMPNVYTSASKAGHTTLPWNSQFSDRQIQKASYWKIATVELGYNFNDAWFNGIVSNVRCYVSAQNLATISKYIGYNVDFAGGIWTPGINNQSYPTPRTFMFGLQASF